jgi:DNA-binding beta-propeller fold protein YncE
VPISLKNILSRRKSAFLSTLLLLTILILLSACGDQYRPIVIPIPQPGGDPQATHYAVVVNTNNGQPINLTTGIGPSASQIDVSGDTNLGNRRTGLNPVHAAIGSISQAFTVNQGDDSVTVFSLVLSTITSTIALEPNSGASYVAALGTAAYVSETNLNRVAIVDSGIAGVRAFINVGSAPKALAVTPNGRRVFVANTGDGTISVISTQDSSVLGNPIAVGGVPVSMAMQTSGAYLFAVNSNGGALSVIDTTANQQVQRLTGLTNPTQVVWEEKLQRVYVVDPGSNSIKIYNGAAPSLSLLRTINLPGTPLGIAALDDGTKFYVMYGGAPGSVGVYDTQSFQLLRTLTVQNTPVSIAASPGSSKVYVVNQTGDAGSASPSFPDGSVSIIKTSDDTVSTLGTGSIKPVFVTTI